MMRKLLLLFACALVSIGAWADNLTGGGSYSVIDGVVTFSGTTAGAIANSNFNFGDGTRIKFDNTCVINKADLEKFLQGNKYYVDLLDITNGTNTPMKVDDYTTTDDDNNADNIDMIIEAAVADMVSNGWQAKGIILPLNTGSGTAKVEMASSNGGETFTEYAVYYRDTQKTAAIYAHDGNMRYSWEWNNANTNAQTHYDTAYTHLSSHSEVANAETYIVSTNNKKRGSDDGLDLSNITGNVTKISIINDELVYKNQTGRSTLAGITVEGVEAGAFASAVANTGLKSTPCEKLIVQGPVSGDDVKAVNDFTTAEGPLVYSLEAATGVTKEMLPTITNSKLEYIVLPYAMAAEQIAADDFSSSLTSLKAAIAPSADKTKLSAYVKQAGSLGMARYYATGGTFNNNRYQPNTTGLTDVILSGNLNASDINAKGTVGADGHWGTSDQNISGMNSEQTTIKKFDLENAVFANQEDMNFYKAGYETLTTVILPTSEQMTLIPEDCFNGNKTLKEICIPYNYETIRSRAFHGTAVEHITTTDANGALIDNGEHTWTLSANIRELGSVPSESGVFVDQVFQHDLLVTDIYILATKAPKCYAGVFPANASYGYGGASGSDKYCRDRYYNSEDRLSKAWLVLRFPSEESYNAAKAAGQATDATYEQMKANYTDPTRVYTKKEQTGAVDANGDEITWPTRQEANRSYNQGSRGLTWEAWDTTSGSASQGEDGAIAGGKEPKGAATGYKATNDGMPATTSGYTFDADYMGWHQLALAMATYYEPAEKVEDEKIIREYQEAGWYTICLPYNLSIKQVREWLGVPKSEGNVVCKLYDAAGTLLNDSVETAIMPDFRQLYAVERAKAGTKKDNKGNIITQNMVYLRMTNNLWNDGHPQYLTFNLDAAPGSVIHYADAHTDGTTTVDDDNCMIGGRPYIIKAYKRKGETISRQNIGKLIMTRYADQFESAASCVANGEYEQLGTGNLATLQFAKPFENHKVQAKNGNPAAPGYMSYEDEEDGQTKRYFYTMIGQFWEQPLPLYSLYMSKGSWYRYTGTKDKNGQPYVWDPYKCVIMATVEIADTDHPKSGGYRDNSEGASNYPQPKENTTDLLESDFKLQFLDGRDDDDFQNYAQSKYVFVFDDMGVTEFGENGDMVTAIDNLDGEDLTVGADSKVYNMSGQYVGNSLNGLGKGMYIVNGKKFVVK